MRICVTNRLVLLLLLPKNGFFRKPGPCCHEHHRTLGSHCCCFCSVPAEPEPSGAHASELADMLLPLLDPEPWELPCWHMLYHPVITNGAVLPGQKPRSPHLPAAPIDVSRSKSRKTNVASRSSGLLVSWQCLPWAEENRKLSAQGIGACKQFPASCNSEQSKKIQWEWSC